MDPNFSQIVAEWQTFYFTLGAAAATLTGLLFVAVSLHLDQFSGQGSLKLRGFAYKTLIGFVNLLFLSLYFLMPRATPMSLAFALIATSLIAGVILGRKTPLQAELIRKMGVWRFFWRFLMPELGQGGIIVVAVLLYFGQTSVLPALVPLVLLLLGTNVLNTWDLLVQVGQEKREETAEQAEHPQLRRLEQQLREVTRRQRQITRQQEETAARNGTPPLPPRRRG